MIVNYDPKQMFAILYIYTYIVNYIYTIILIRLDFKVAHNFQFGKSFYLRMVDHASPPPEMLPMFKKTQTDRLVATPKEKL